MDITHTGSSMKWRTSLLVLQNQVKFKSNALLRYSSPTVTNPSRYNCNSRNPPSPHPTKKKHTSALTSSFLCNNS